jgi:protein phosphatase PTC7
MRHFHSIVFLQCLVITSTFIYPKPSKVLASSKTCLFEAPQPLAQEGTWQAFLDNETTGLVYYFDTETGESLWEPPSSTFPEVRLARKEQRLAEELRRTYRKARQQQEAQQQEVQQQQASAGDPGNDVGSGLPSWIEGLLVVKEKTSLSSEPQSVAQPVVEKDEKFKDDKGGFFSVFFGEKGSKEEDIVVVDQPLEDETTVVVTTQKRGFFSVFEGIAKGMGPKADVVATEVQEEVPIPTYESQKEQEFEIEDRSPRPIKIEMGSHVLPHPAKVRWGGEDALFVKGRTFGVFDGVSGAEKLNGVPLYSRTLADEMKKVIGTDGLTIPEITKLLTDAANIADDSATGASTAVVASIGENGFLQALNIGDSLCMVVRDEKVVAKTREISHYWECPYQLSDDSPDRPKDGTKLNVELIAGDLVIMGSDGIFDNVSDDMLLDLVAKNAKLKPSQLSKKICELSRKQSLDAEAETPYGKQAQRRGDPTFKNGRGGKLDDASCIVVVCK